MPKTDTTRYVRNPKRNLLLQILGDTLRPMAPNAIHGLSGYLSQLYGMDPKTGEAVNPTIPALQNAYKDRQDIPHGDTIMPGLVESTEDIPYSFSPGDGPVWSRKANERSRLIASGVRDSLGIGEPHGFMQNMYDAGGTMLAQAPTWLLGEGELNLASKLPRAFSKVPSMVSGALEKVPSVVKTPVKAGLEWVDPQVHDVRGYGYGALFGGALGTLQDEEPWIWDKLQALSAPVPHYLSSEQAGVNVPENPIQDAMKAVLSSPRKDVDVEDLVNPRYPINAPTPFKDAEKWAESSHPEWVRPGSDDSVSPRDTWLASQRVGFQEGSPRRYHPLRTPVSWLVDQNEQFKREHPDYPHTMAQGGLARYAKGSGVKDVLKLFRGVRGHVQHGIEEGALKGEPRIDYSTFMSESPHVAATYANPLHHLFPEEVGAIVPHYVKPKEIIEFPVHPAKDASGNRFDPFEFDRQAARLKPGQVLVARKVYDIGPRANREVDPDLRFSYPADVYAVGHGTDVKAGIGEEGYGYGGAVHFEKGGLNKLAEALKALSINPHADARFKGHPIGDPAEEMIHAANEGVSRGVMSPEEAATIKAQLAAGDENALIESLLHMHEKLYPSDTIRQNPTLQAQKIRPPAYLEPPIPPENPLSQEEWENIYLRGHLPPIKKAKGNVVKALTKKSQKLWESFRSPLEVKGELRPTERQTVQEWMNTEEWPMSEDYAHSHPKIQKLERLSNKYGVPEPITLWRGLNIPDEPRNPGWEVGAHPQSWTADRDLAEVYSKAGEGTPKVLEREFLPGQPGMVLRDPEGRLDVQHEILVPAKPKGPGKILRGDPTFVVDTSVRGLMGKDLRKLLTRKDWDQFYQQVENQARSGGIDPKRGLTVDPNSPLGQLWMAMGDTASREKFFDMPKNIQDLQRKSLDSRSPKDFLNLLQAYHQSVKGYAKGSGVKGIIKGIKKAGNVIDLSTERQVREIAEQLTNPANRFTPDELFGPVVPNPNRDLREQIKYNHYREPYHTPEEMEAYQSLTDEYLKLVKNPNRRKFSPEETEALTDLSRRWDEIYERGRRREIQALPPERRAKLDPEAFDPRVLQEDDPFKVLTLPPPKPKKFAKGRGVKGPEVKSALLKLREKLAQGISDIPEIPAAGVPKGQELVPTPGASLPTLPEIGPEIDYQLGELSDKVGAPKPGLTLPNPNVSRRTVVKGIAGALNPINIPISAEQVLAKMAKPALEKTLSKVRTPSPIAFDPKEVEDYFRSNSTNWDDDVDDMFDPNALGTSISYHLTEMNPEVLQFLKSKGLKLDEKGIEYDPKHRDDIEKELNSVWNEWQFGDEETSFGDGPLAQKYGISHENDVDDLHLTSELMDKLDHFHMAKIRDVLFPSDSDYTEWDEGRKMLEKFPNSEKALELTDKLKSYDDYFDSLYQSGEDIGSDEAVRVNDQYQKTHRELDEELHKIVPDVQNPDDREWRDLEETPVPRVHPVEEKELPPPEVHALGEQLRELQESLNNVKSQKQEDKIIAQQEKILKKMQDLGWDFEGDEDNAGTYMKYDPKNYEDDDDFDINDILPERD
jgi:hypothetical protein